MKNLKKTLALLLVLAMCLALFAACGGDDSATKDQPDTTTPSDTTGTPDGSAEPAGGDTGSDAATGDDETVIVIGIPNTWNQLIAPQPASAYHLEVCEKIYDRLARLNEAGEAEPRAAESWELSDDMKTITFHLRENSYFHDGVQVTSADWRWSIELMTSEAGSNFVTQDKFPCIEGTNDAGLLEDGAELGIETPDEFTLVVHLKQPMTVDSFIYNYGFLWYVYPKHILENEDMSNPLEWSYWQNPIGSGPCKFVSQDAGATEITLDAVKDYPVGNIQFDRLIFRVISQDAAASAYLSGEINLYYMGFTQETMAPLVGVEGLRADRMDNVSSFSALAINNERFDSNFRHAVNLAIDKDMLVEAMYSGDADATNTPVRQNSEYCDNTWAGRDVDAAKEYLAKSNYDGSTLSFAISAGRGEQIGAVVQQGLAEVGINVELITLDTATTLAGLTDGTYDMGIVNYTSGGNPTWICSTNMFGLNVGHIDDAKYLELRDQASLCTDPAEMTKIAGEFQDLIDEEQPFVPLFHYYSYYIMSDWLSNVSSIETTACYDWVVSK